MKLLYSKTRVTTWLLLMSSIICFVCACNPSISGTLEGTQATPTPSQNVNLATAIPLEGDSAGQSNPQQEFLVIWGTEAASSDCMLWLINAETQEISRPIVETPWCNFAVSTSSGDYKLVSFQPYHPISETQSSEIVVYDVVPGGTLHSRQTIVLEGLRLTDVPQWGPDNSVYFSAINNGQESIYRYDSETHTITPYIDSDSGFATSPVISQDGRYIAYEVWRNHDSRDGCGQQTCFSRFVQIWDIEMGSNISVAPQDEAEDSNSLQCNPEWSDIDNLLAFEIGCGLQTPGSIMMYDANAGKVFSTITSVNDTSIINFGWAGDKLILNGSVQLSGDNSIHNGYLAYSIDNNILQELRGLPQRNIFDSDLVYFSDWTNNGEVAVGHTQIPGETRTVNIVMANSWDELDEDTYVQSLDEFIDNPTWSLTNDYVAYRSYNWEAKESESRFTILNAGGTMQFDSGMIKLKSPRFLWYIQ